MEEAIFADGRPDADRERRLRRGVHGRHRNGPTDPPAAVGRRAGLPPRWISVRTGACWPPRRSRDRSSCGTSKTGAPYGSPLTADTSPVNDVVFSPDGRTLVSSHLRSAVVWDMSGDAGDRRAAGRPDGPDHGRVVQPRRHVARRRAVRRRDGRVRHERLDGRPPDRRRLDRHRSRLPSRRKAHRRRNDRREGPILRSEERGGRWLARSTRGARRSGRSASAPTVGCSPLPWTRTASDGFYGQQRQGEVQLWDVGSRRRVGTMRSRRAADRCSPWPSDRDGTLLATGSYCGAARPVGCGDPGRATASR